MSKSDLNESGRIDLMDSVIIIIIILLLLLLLLLLLVIW